MKQILHTIFLAVALTSLFACSTKAPMMGLQDGQFASCTEKDCVSSQATDEHHIAPIKATGDPDVVMVDLVNSIETIFGGKVLETEGTYLRAEFKSSILRTVDDAEFYYDEKAGEIHVRSVSRGDPLDFEDTRDRIEEVRAAFAKLR